MTPLLEPPDTCSWLDAELTAQILEALAAELYIEAGPKPEGRGIGTALRRHRWLGQHQVVNRVRYRALRYRQRQLALTPSS